MQSAGHTPAHSSQPMHFSMPSSYRLRTWRPCRRSGLAIFSSWVSLPFLWFFLKVLLFLFTLVWIRGTLPRFRYDQLMDLGWKFLIPLALGWFLVLVALRISDDEGWNWGIVAVLLVLGLTALAGLLSKAIRTSEERRELEEVSD